MWRGTADTPRVGVARCCDVGGADSGGGGANSSRASLKTNRSPELTVMS